jgi:hypothetical protein
MDNATLSIAMANGAPQSQRCGPDGATYRVARRNVR